VDIPLRYIVVLDEATDTLRLVYGFTFASYATREDALRFVRSRGLKLAAPGGQPEPPEAAAGDVGPNLGRPTSVST
jgi:hypothetical protein